MKYNIFALLVLPLMLVGCLVTTPTKPDGSIADQTKIKTIDYTNYWQFIKTADGKDLQEAEIKLSYEERRFGDDKYLRVCGGLRPQYYVLTTEDDQTIANPEELKKTIGKIKSPEEAVGFLYATNCGLSNKFESQNQFVNRTDKGYLVSLIYYNWFGCGDHAHTSREYLLDESGKYKLEKEVKLERGEEFCGD